ncbi:dephospho-CoA kinase domain-containing protein [Athene noctua]|uniref:dephospho-CoA kinase domain-containing protein n=1 Tax=Athene noctua TaxID=126797 RepID=UPI003EB9F664
MFLVGLSGGIASGKSTVVAVLRELGCAVIDADVIAREVVQPRFKAYQQIVRYFGTEILLENGEINREALANIIFSHPEKRQLLNSITHPEIQKEMLKQILKHFVLGWASTSRCRDGKICLELEKLPLDEGDGRRLKASMAEPPVPALGAAGHAQLGGTAGDVRSSGQWWGCMKGGVGPSGPLRACQPLELSPAGPSHVEVFRGRSSPAAPAELSRLPTLSPADPLPIACPRARPAASFPIAAEDSPHRLERILHRLQDSPHLPWDRSIRTLLDTLQQH